MSTLSNVSLGRASGMPACRAPPPRRGRSVARPAIGNPDKEGGRQVNVHQLLLVILRHADLQAARGCGAPGAIMRRSLACPEHTSNPYYQGYLRSRRF